MRERASGGEPVWERYSGEDWKPVFGDHSPAPHERVRETIARLSRLMDAAFEVPGLGWRFGLDALIGLIPGVGDLATTLVSLYILALAGRMGLPRITMARMAMNVAVDMLLGSLPLVGDVFDVWWKANLKNAALLEERLGQSAVEARRGRMTDWIFVGAMIAALVILFAAIVALAALVAGAAWNAAAGLFRT